LNNLGKIQLKTLHVLALATFVLAFGLSTTAEGQNTAIATPTPTPAQKAGPPPKPKGGGTGISIPYVPPPPGPSKLPPAGGALCMIIPGCKPPAPQIDGAFPFSNLTPGGYVIVYGKHLNSLSGPTGKLQFSVGGTIHDLVDLQWSDTAVGGRVPDGWNWSQEEEVDMWVVRADGVKTNNLSPRPKFSPTWDIQMLPGTEVNQFNCAQADYYKCTNQWGGTVQGSHDTVYGHDSGTDSYKVDRLMPGWKLDSYTFTILRNKNGSVQPPSGFLQGYDWVDLQVHWDQDGGSILDPSNASTLYEIDIFVRGPKGAPLRH
jgi:hypothetical protein